MTEVIRFPGHKWYRCPPTCEGCFICNGGLSCCVTCGGAESSLTTDCRQQRLTGDQCDQVSEGVLNYRDGQFWCEDASRILVRRK